MSADELGRAVQFLNGVFLERVYERMSEESRLAKIYPEHEARAQNLGLLAKNASEFADFLADVLEKKKR
ncbi:Uncharacterised protein [Candidatus Norongarragalina meridionalis]|nr:Uncharacterised protein [Candidatus Norongarragalina meridionalis]